MPLVGALVAAGFAPEFALAITAIMAGLVLAILAFALFLLLEQPLTYILRRIPAIGGGLADAVHTGLTAITTWINSWIGPAIQPLVTLFLAPVQAVVGFVSTVVAAFEYVMHQLVLVTDQAAGAVGILATRAAQALAQAGLALARTAAAAASALEAINLGKLIRYSLLPAAIASAVATARAFTLGQVNAESQARQAAAAKAAATAAAAVAAEQLARQRADEQNAARAATAAAATAAALVGLRELVTDLEQVKVRALEDELTDVRTRAIPAEQARAQAAEATLTAELATAGEALRCLDPLCSSGFSSLLGGMLAGAELVAILELVGAAVSDPEGAAHSTAQGAGGLINQAAGLLSVATGARF